MRHQWEIKKLNKKHPITKCKRCGCYKQIMWPIGVVYDMPGGHGFEDKAPKCKEPDDKNQEDENRGTR